MQSVQSFIMAGKYNNNKKLKCILAMVILRLTMD